MVGGVLGQHLLVLFAGLRHLLPLRVVAGHHVQQFLWRGVARREIDGVADLLEGVARLAGTRPVEAAPHEELGRADVAVVARQRPELVAARGVVHDVLQLLLDLALARQRLLLAGAGHLVLVEERADVVAVDRPEHELVRLEGLGVESEVLQQHAQVVPDEAKVPTQLQPTAVGRVLQVADGAGPLAPVGHEHRLHLLPERLEVRLGLLAVDGLHVRHAAEEQAFRNGTALGPEPEVGHAEYRHLLRDVRIGAEPRLQEVDHAQFAEGEGEIAARLLAGRDALLLDQVRELAAVRLVLGLLEGLDADDVELLPARGGGHAQVRVQQAVRDQPRARAHAVEQLVRADVRERAVLAVAAERVHDARQQKDERKAAAHERCGLPTDLVDRQRHVGFVLLHRQRHARQQKPVGEQVAAARRHERGRGHGRRAEREEKMSGRERRGRGEDAAHRHRRMEEVLAPRALVVQPARGGEGAGDERQHGEERHHKAARTEDPLVDLALVGVDARPQHVAGLLELAVRRARQLQERVRDVVRQHHVPGHERHEEQRHRDVELEAVLHHRRDQRKQKHRNERHEYRPLEHAHRHGQSQDGRKHVRQAREAHKRHVQHEHRQRERHVELAHVQMRGRGPCRRGEHEHHRRADTGQERRRTRVLDRVLLPDGLVHEEPDKIADEAGRQHAAHEPHQVQGHGGFAAEGRQQPAPDRMERQRQDVQPLPLREELRRLARIEIPRKRQSVQDESKKRRAQCPQPQQPARRSPKRLLLHTGLLRRGVRRLYVTLFVVCHKNSLFF